MTEVASNAVTKKPRIGSGTLRNSVIVALLILWELLPRLELVSPIILAPLSEALYAGISNFGTFAQHLLITMGEIALGLLIAYGVGGIIGLLLGSIRSFRQVLLPLFSSVYAVPFVIVYPVLTAWWGIGPESKVLFGGIYGLFPMVLATAAGVQTVDRQLVLATRSMGASTRQILLQVMVPSALPSIVSGLRLGGALVAIGVVVAEMMASTSGIGFLISGYRTMFMTGEVYFGILLVLVMAGTLDWLIGTIERRTATWHSKDAPQL
jgi:NitT/TauT family transport system permease protein/taurine transport system permease protein